MSNLPAIDQKFMSVKGLFSRPDIQGQIAAALPRVGLTPERVTRVVLTELRQNPRLLDCDQLSLLGAVIQACQLGLQFGSVLGQAYIVPFKNNRANPPRLECQLIPGYRGLIALARRSGELATIAAHIVHANDDFDYALGLEDRLNHRPNLENPGPPRLAYAIARFRDGSYHLEVMSWADIKTIRDRSKGYKNDPNNSPWATDIEEMAKKTVIRRLCKFLPLTIEAQDAVALHDQAEGIGFDPVGTTALPIATDSVQQITEAQGLDDLYRDLVATTGLAEEPHGLRKYVRDIAKANNFTEAEVIHEGLGDAKRFWKYFFKKSKAESERATKNTPPPAPEPTSPPAAANFFGSSSGTTVDVNTPKPDSAYDFQERDVPAWIRNFAKDRPDRLTRLERWLRGIGVWESDSAINRYLDTLGDEETALKTLVDWERRNTGPEGEK